MSRGLERSDPPKVFARPSILVPGPKRTRTGVPCATCGKATADGKEFCEDHLAAIPYVQGVMADVEAMEREAKDVEDIVSGIMSTRARASRLRTLHVPRLEAEASLALAVRTLEAGAMTVERLARSLPIGQNATLLVLRRLEDKGLAEPRGATKRGSALWRSTRKALGLFAEFLT